MRTVPHRASSSTHCSAQLEQNRSLDSYRKITARTVFSDAAVFTILNHGSQTLCFVGQALPSR